jgi:hypothetical protein
VVVGDVTVALGDVVMLAGVGQAAAEGAGLAPLGLVQALWQEGKAAKVQVRYRRGFRDLG